MISRWTLYPVLFVLLFLGCDSGSDDTPPTPDPEVLTTATFVTSLSVAEINASYGLWPDAMNLTHYGIDAYRITYLTHDLSGHTITASGLVLLPQRNDPASLLSVQHSTFFATERSPSLFDSERSVAWFYLAAASAGYVCALPDYLGYGITHDLWHPYHHAETLASASLDMMRATEEFLIQQGQAAHDSWFLAGYSEGGFATAALQRELEANHSDAFTLRAVSAGGGAYDLLETGRAILAKPTLSLAEASSTLYILLALNEAMGLHQNVSVFFKEPYLSRIRQMLPDLMQNRLTSDEIEAQLTTVTDDLFTDALLAEMRSAAETPFTNAFRANNLLDWQPQAPLRLYHSDQDDLVPYTNALIALEHFTQNGAHDVELIPFTNQNHRGGFFPFIFESIAWFNTF